MKEFRYCPRCSHSLIAIRKEGRKRLACPECGWINYENPLPSVAVVIRKGDKILLVKRGVEPGKGRWALPSGFIEIEETPQKACLRELKEETGLKGKIKRLIGVYSQRTKIYKNVLIISYEVIPEGKPKPGSDTKEVKFFSLKNLPPIPFSSHRKTIRDIKE